MNQTVARLVIVFAISIPLTLPLRAANKPKPAATDAVQESLQAELQSTQKSFDRRDELQPGSQSGSDSNPTWWQAGYVQSGKEWLKVEDSRASGASLTLLDDYRVQRAKLTDQPQGEMQLANWCRKHGLPDQERVHLLRVLNQRVATENTDAVYQRLGCQKIDGVWVSPQERRELARQNSEIEQSHKRWDTKFATWTKQLEGSAKTRALAEKQLSEVTDPSAVPAIISWLCMRSQSLGEVGVKVLDQIPEYQASRALAGQAVFSPWKSVRMRAVDSLKQRKWEEYAPDLLMLLSGPVRIELKPSAENPMNGIKFNWDFAWVEETHDTLWVGIGRIIPTSLSSENVAAERVNSRGALDGVALNDGRSLSANEVRRLGRQELLQEFEALKFNAERATDLRQELNERVAKVLSDSTGEPMSSDPKTWWNWWANYAAVSPSEKSKKVVVKDKRPMMPIVTMVAPRQHSCFAAGTPVWTELGLVSIEQIVPGDRVLAKEPNSGELMYKPVMQITKREPTKVHKIHVAGDDIVANLGHHFWVDGEGWTKTRHLAADQPLHTVTGMQRISSIEDEGREQEVFNLIVADFHTYFVGKSMVLSHDVTTPQLTNAKIPGMLPR